MFKNLFLKTNKASNCKITMQAPKDREDSKWLKLDPQTNQSLVVSTVSCLGFRRHEHRLGNKIL